MSTLITKTSCRPAWHFPHREECSKKSKLLGSAEDICTPTWPQNVCHTLEAGLCVSERQFVLCRVLELLYPPTTVRKVSENILESSVERQGFGVKTACMYQFTASAAAQSEVRSRSLHQGCHARLVTDRRTVRALSGKNLRDRCSSRVGVGVGVGVGRALVGRSRHCKLVGSLISLLLSVRDEPGGEDGWPSVRHRALLTLTVCLHQVELRREYGTLNVLHSVFRENG